jgi:arylsulfatase A-like enzyme
MKDFRRVVTMEDRRSVRLAALGFLLVALLWLVACGDANITEGPPRPGRIILVSMDTVRADHVTGYGVRETTPTLAEIAEEGVVLKNFYSASTYTLPSHMSIFTGLDPQEHGVFRDEAELNPGVPTLSEILAHAGYETAAFHEGGYVSPRYGFARGFGSYRELPRLAAVEGALPEILSWLRGHQDQPYFLFIHTYAAHYPYGGWDRYRAQADAERGLPGSADIEELRVRWNGAHARRTEGRAPDVVPKQERSFCTLYNQLSESHAQILGCGDNYLSADLLDSRTADQDVEAVKASYDERISKIDRALGEIRRVLIDLGEWDDTLLIVTADHGEAFLEHGSSQHDYNPFNEVIKVPAVISYPKLLQQGSVRMVEEATWHLDLMPTILGLSGIPVPSALKGLDLAPILTGEQMLPSGRTVYPAILRLAHRESRPVRRVAVEGSMKFVEGDARFGDPEGLLFDLSKDPEEQDNLRVRRQKEFRALSERATLWHSSLTPHPSIHQETGRFLPTNPAVEVPQIELSTEDREKLRELGYAD